MLKNKHSSRRGFLGSAALGGGAIALSAQQTHAADTSKKGRKLKIGAIGVGEFSFWGYSWCDLLAPTDKPFYKDTLGTNIFNMEVTHVWDRDPVKARAFADFMDAEVVKRYDGMVDKVDAVAFGGYYEVPWQHRLARPYIEAGIPTFLDRPFAFSLRDIDDLLDLIAKHGTPVMATDVYEHLYDATNLRNKLSNLGEISCAHGTCWGMDYNAHFHIKFMVPKIFGYEVERVSILTDNPYQSSYLIGSWLMKGQQQKPFLVSSTMNQGDLYSITVSGSKGLETARMPWIDDWNRNLLGEHVSMMVDMQRTFEGHTYESLDIIRKKTEIFLTGLYSATERKGAFVKVGDVPVEWRGPDPKPGWIDESIFS
ncbi:MAG: Gfo/Idh/MocA family oxidoreductase [Candidatus Latescibacteria bacterium]|nr:Gfo/Idh/MocA family oxidoreductase [Candidatus Latescibacterota bacterium]